jgi:hypothetical protein
MLHLIDKHLSEKDLDELRRAIRQKGAAQVNQLPKSSRAASQPFSAFRINNC